MKNVLQSSQIILINKEDNSKVLGVSRKHDHNDFGMPGGKREEYDLTPEDCIIRECKEETGLDIFNLKLIDQSVWGGREQFTYVGEYSGIIFTREPHKVDWVTPQDLINGTFGEFNKMILELLEIV